MELIRKIFCLLFLFVVFSAVKPQVLLAGSDFNIDSAVKYEFNQDGEAYVSNRITLENKVSTVFAKSYSISLQNVYPKNINVTDDNNNSYIFTKSDDGEYTNIKIEFPDSLVGKGVSRKFLITYFSNAYSRKYGEIFEVNIPKISDPENYRSYGAEVIIPDLLGKKSYMSPSPSGEYASGDKTVYVFNKSILSASGVSAAFGEFQVFDFTLNYHLENPLAKMGETEIALPPDTSHQKVIFDEITPRPIGIKADPDGNWMARYILSPRQRIDISVRGSVKIFSKGEKQKTIDQTYLSSNLAPTEFWQSEDPEIKSLALRLSTPRNIYDYVVNKLTYNYGKVQPNSERLGALKALGNPANAICTEFTDLFIALCRAAGIPAREINGYAYADDTKIQPMSLVADVLHAWPEYWDTLNKTWVPVDPTWGKTTGGEDFFDKLDLRHFTFVIHGLNSDKPYPPGSYKLGQSPEKDIFVAFGKLRENKINNVNLSVPGHNKIYYPGRKIAIKIQNNSGFSIENENLLIYFDGKESYRETIPLILPYSPYTISIDYPFSLFGRKSPKEIKILYSGSEYSIAGIKTVSVLISLLLIFGCLTILIVTYICILKRNTIAGFFKMVSNRYKL